VSRTIFYMATRWLDPNNPSPQQMAALHREVQQKNPGVLGEIRNHPLVAGVLGGIATYEVDRHFGKQG